MINANIRQFYIDEHFYSLSLTKTEEEIQTNKQTAETVDMKEKKC